MCEYTKGCSETDDLEAKLLWTSSGRARSAWIVRCPREYHPLLGVYDLPTRGRMLLLPHYSAKNRSMFVDPADPDAEVHRHWGLIPLDEYGPGEFEYGRCRCGTWSVVPAHMDPARWGSVHHRHPYVLANYVSTADSASARRKGDRRD